MTVFRFIVLRLESGSAGASSWFAIDDFLPFPTLVIRAVFRLAFLVFDGPAIDCLIGTVDFRGPL